MDTNPQQDDGDERPGDLLVGRNAIRDFLIVLGLPETVDPYYLKTRGWPFGKLAGGTGQLVASKRRLIRHVEKITRGTAA